LKFVTYILTFSILFLLGKPAIDAIQFSVQGKANYCNNSKCNTTSESKKSESTSDNEEDGICNPFQACGSCLLLCVKTAFFPVVQAKILNENLFAYQPIFGLQFIGDFWQPPQFV